MTWYTYGMDTVVMAIAVIRKGDRVLIRKFDPARNPYKDKGDWGLVGATLIDHEITLDEVNKGLKERWNITVIIKEHLAQSEEEKVDYDGKKKRFIYRYVLCELATGEPWPVANPNEELRWPRLGKELAAYSLNPPTLRIFNKLHYL